MSKWIRSENAQREIDELFELNKSGKISEEQLK